MASLRSKLFVLLLKYRNLFKFQLKRKNEITWDTSIPDLRKQTENPSGLFGKLPKGLHLESVNIDNIYAEWITPEHKKKDKVILYFHGGGYVIGSAVSHRVHVAKFVNNSNVSALVFDYRLAPENPFPAALNDSISAYKYLLKQKIKSENIVFIGDSAGGGLCLATLLALKDKNLALPAAAVVLSPWTDLKCTGESLKTNIKKDVLTWKESWTIFSYYYAKDQDLFNPYISPLYGNLKDLCPILVYAGGDELLLSDSTRFVKKAKKAGVKAEIKIGKGLFHCYPVCSPLFPEAKKAMKEICEFIKKEFNI